MIQLKQVYYPGNIARGRVVYAFFGKKRCVFSGIKTPFSTSTINAAEAIIEAIAHEEDINPLDVEFYDLQTFRGYDKKAGQYEFDRIKFTLNMGHVSDPRWLKTECPDKVIDTFRPYVFECLEPDNSTSMVPA